MIGRDVEARHPFVLAEFLELDVEADEIAALPRNDQEAALAGRLDRRLDAEVGKVADRQDIHDAPGLVGEVALKRQSERSPHRAARAVAADHEPRLHGLDLPLVRGIEPFEPDGDRKGRRRALPVRFDRKIDQAARIVRLEPRRRIAHDIEIELMHPRLVQDHVRELGQPVFGVLDPGAADDIASPRIIRLPERRLVDPIGLFQHPLAEAERLEHLHRPAGDAVRLAEQQRAGFLFDDAGPDVGKGGQLRRQRQARGPAADDQDIDLPGKGVRSPRRMVRLGRLGDRRIAGSEPVEMELHDVAPSAAAGRTAGNLARHFRRGQSLIGSPDRRQTEKRRSDPTWSGSSFAGRQEAHRCERRPTSLSLRSLAMNSLHIRIALCERSTRRRTSGADIEKPTPIFIANFAPERRSKRGAAIASRCSRRRTA